MTAAPSRSTPIVGPLLVVGTAYLFFFAGAYFGIFDVHVRISSLVIVGVVLGAVTRWRPRGRPAVPGVKAVAGPRDRPRRPCDRHGLLRNRRISLDFLAYGVLLAALYCSCGAAWRDPICGRGSAPPS